MFTHWGTHLFIIYVDLHLLCDALNVISLFRVTMTINILILKQFEHLYLHGGPQ